MPTTLNIEPFVFGREDELRLTARRYTDGGSGNTEGLTLLLTHCLGGHKEQWEPALERIFEVQRQKDKRYQIREAWSFDWPSHGESGIINEKVIAKRPDLPVSPYEWSVLVTEFLKTKVQGHRLVVASHSASTAAMLIAMKEFPTERPPYLGFIIVEPSIISREYFKAHEKARRDFAGQGVKMTLAKRATFPNMEEAGKYLKKRLPYKLWDERTFKLYLEYGLRTKETPEGPIVVPSTDLKQEGLAYPDFPPYLEAVDLLTKHCMAGVIPIHMIFGSRPDFIPTDLQDDLVDSSRGRKLASVTRIKGAGHMVLQEKPDLLADAICEKLTAKGLSRPEASKL